ncbi:PREDICTED: putative FBD-associated F-box protein At1g61330 [Tarenaya hassleriana]|uniref:putative FBD-associated F-box protein At1g61330 n=1 Tax=Tarenaya hassleriana TaxID=28532 RepID=UPI00053C4777|nr:PREDICTED: putative FBD-associated F-box protein At1g61330 [Tarenaya hassleriana]
MSLSNAETKMPEETCSKRIATEGESSGLSVPEDVVQNILSFFPIKNAIKSTLVSKSFRDSWLFCRNLDFSGDFGRRADAIDIIKTVFERNQAPEIKRLALTLCYVGVQTQIETWIQWCLDKGLEELELDFLDGVFPMQCSIDFSALQSLTVLKLCLVEFHMPSSPKGLKFLKSLCLSRILVTEELVASVFKNCRFLENLELVGCHGIRELRINTRNHNRFSSLSIAGCKEMKRILIDAPNLESFTFSGLITLFGFGDVSAVKDLMFHFVTLRKSLMPFSAIDLLSHFSNIQVFTISNVFLEGLTRRYVGRNFTEILFCFHNLRELQLLMESHTYCNLFDIADFVKNCPRLEKFYLDVNDFTFELGLYWEMHQKHLLRDFPYKLNSVKFLEIKGFKNHWHELDIIQFFLQNSPNLDAVALVAPSRPRTRIFEPDFERSRRFKEMAPRVKVTVHEHHRYVPKSPTNHLKRWYYY